MPMPHDTLNSLTNKIVKILKVRFRVSIDSLLHNFFGFGVSTKHVWLTQLWLEETVAVFKDRLVQKYRSIPD